MTSVHYRRTTKKSLSVARYRGRVCCLLLFTLLSAQSSAHLPELFGRRYVLEPTTKIRVETVPERSREEAREMAAQMEEQLKAREAQQGVYSLGLADPLAELGQVYAGLGNHPAALDPLRRALQIQRINEGLLHPSQLPILRALADSYGAIGDTRSEQLTWRYAFRIHGMGLGELDERALEDSLAYFQLARDNYIYPNGQRDDRLFFQAYQDNLAMLEAQMGRGENSFDTLYALGRSQLYNLYILLGTDYSAGLNGMGDSTAAEDNLRRIQMLAYGKGVKMIEALVERAAEQPITRQSELELRLANWHQWNGKWQRSCDSYARVWSLADGSLREALAIPAALPEDPAVWESLQGDHVPIKVTVASSFRVSARGDASRVNSRLVGEGSSALAGRVTRMLRDSHFRPAISEEGCIVAEVADRYYRLLD